jgi:type II secretory pathway component PulF
MAIEIQTTRSPVERKPMALGATSLESVWARGKPRPGSKDRMFFTERLALLLETGHPLHVSLETLTTHASGTPLCDTIEELRRDVDAGLSFSQALAKHPQAFPKTYVKLVAAGEQGGFLPAVLRRLTEMEERRQELRDTLMSAISYPLFLMLFSVAVVVFVLVVVFPKFSELFILIKDELPLSTLILMTASDIARGWWPLIAVVTAGAALLLYQWGRTHEGSEQLERAAIGLPLVGRTFVQLNLVVFLRVLSLSLANGVPLLDTLHAARDVVRGSRFRRIIDLLEAGVQEGRGFAWGLQQDDLLPDLAKQMLTTGEESGNMALVSERVADFYEREWRKRLQNLAKLAEPVMLLLMGAVVGLVVSSLILPIFKLSRAIH